MPVGPIWSDDEDDLLIQLWRDGLSASEIVKRIRFRSRSSVLGRVSRLRQAGRLEARVAPKEPEAAAGPKPALKPTPAPVRVAPPRSPPARADTWGLTKAEDRKPAAPIPADQLTPTARPYAEHRIGQCRWPFERPDGWWACCAPAAAEGANYCADHHAIAFRPTPKLRVGDLRKLAA